MVKKLVAHRNSSCIVLEKPILELLKINRDTDLEITTDGTSLIISPVDAEKRRSRMDAILKKVNRNHGASLKELAEYGELDGIQDEVVNILKAVEQIMKVLSLRKRRKHEN